MENINSYNSESKNASKIQHSKINTPEDTFLEIKQKKSSKSYSSSESSNNNDIKNNSDFDVDNDLDNYDENINKKLNKMQIFVKTLTGRTYLLDVEQTDTIIKLKEMIQEKYGIPPDQQKFFFNKRILNNNKTIKDYKILKEQTIYLILRLRGGFIDKLSKEEKKEIGFDLSLIKRNELNVNIIYFDLNLKNKENYNYYNKLKIDVVGIFYAIDDLQILKENLEENQLKNKIPYIIISSGTSGKDVIELCKKYSFIEEVIIFCRNYNYNKHYLASYPNYVKKVLISIESVYKYIDSSYNRIFENKEDKESFEEEFDNKLDDNWDDYKKEEKYIFSNEKINMNKHLIQCPVISALEYDNCYFLIHKAYSFFFKKIQIEIRENNLSFFDLIINVFKKKKPVVAAEPIFKESYFNNMKLIFFEHDNIKKKLNDLVDITDNNIFVENSIRLYCNESSFCYIINKKMRNFDKGLTYLAYYIGPLLYGLNKYVFDNPSFGLFKNYKLYRITQCSKLEFYQYKLNLGHIICFPSLTSTSYEPINFNPTDLANKVNNITNKESLLNLKMIFDYKHNSENISPGIIIGNNKGHDGLPLSKYDEKEVLLFPFTFAKINKIFSEEIKGVNFQVIIFEIIGRKSYLEYKLKDDVQNRVLFSKLEKNK